MDTILKGSTNSEHPFGRVYESHLYYNALANLNYSKYHDEDTISSMIYDDYRILRFQNDTLDEKYNETRFGNYSCDSNDDVSNEDLAAWSSGYFKSIVYLLYISIFIFALLGNGTVCYIVQSTPRMRTVTNYFIANLAVGDILMSLFCVPFSFVTILILNYWPFGIVLCSLVNYSQAVSVLVSAYTLVAISVDRYIAIMWPLRPRITKRYAKCIIAGVWIIALMTAFPIPIVSKLAQPDNWHVQCDKYICHEDWPSKEQNFYYTIALLTLQFVIPLSVLIFTYTRIALAVWGKRPPGEAENSRDQRMARSKRKGLEEMDCFDEYPIEFETEEAEMTTEVNCSQEPLKNSLLPVSTTKFDDANKLNTMQTVSLGDCIVQTLEIIGELENSPIIYLNQADADISKCLNLPQTPTRLGNSPEFHCVFNTISKGRGNKNFKKSVGRKLEKRRTQEKKRK